MRNANVFGAGSLIFGTVVTSTIALVIAVPLGIAIGVYLSLLAPGRAGAVIGPLVELLAAVPSVIIGLWGIIVLGAVPALDGRALRCTACSGFIPIFGPPSATGLDVFTAGVVLAMMVLPIIASISRDLFLSVPRELKDGALALGATRWEMIRGVVLDSTRAGLVAATILGLSRGARRGDRRHADDRRPARASTRNLFTTGDTIASRIAEQFPGQTGAAHVVALLLRARSCCVMEIVVNFAAQAIVRRFERRKGIAR